MTQDKHLKTVALIGRPNVGKSTLFNRLVEKRIAIETPIPGTTRDRLFGKVYWQGYEFSLMDVAGVEFGTKKEIDKNIQEGVKFAIQNADLILFIVDWNDSVNEIDRNISRLIRSSKKDTILVINKADNAMRQGKVDEFKRLGNFSVVPVSAISGMNTGDLLNMVIEKLQKLPAKGVLSEQNENQIQLAIIGRPNVGKSTLLNSLIGEKRAVVSEEAGTTRDVVRISFFHDGKNIEISDTAGIRRPGKIEKSSIEAFSLLRTMNALKGSDVAILLIDAEEGLVALDANILGKAKEWGKGIILAVNKIDTISGDQKEYMAKMIWELQGKLNFAPWLPLVFISARENENVRPLLNQVVKVYENRNTLIPQVDLNEILNDAKVKNPQLAGLTSLIQRKTNPPIFEIRYKGRSAPHYTQTRYLENKIRDVYPMSGTPIFIDLAAKAK